MIKITSQLQNIFTRDGYFICNLQKQHSVHHAQEIAQYNLHHLCYSHIE